MSLRGSGVIIDGERFDFIVEPFDGRPGLDCPPRFKCPPENVWQEVQKLVKANVPYYWRHAYDTNPEHRWVIQLHPEDYRLWMEQKHQQET